MANSTLDDYCHALRTELHLIRDTNATFTSLSNRTMDFWKSSRGTVVRIEVLVIVITIIQLFLAIFGSWRRRSRNFFQKGVLAAYTLSSTLISYTLGSMQSSAVKSSMYTVWAISVYILFGCTDSITAYSVTDNSQITRQIIQSALGVSYVLFVCTRTLHYMSFNFYLFCIVLPSLIVFKYYSSFQRLLACRLASASWHMNTEVAYYMDWEHTIGEPPYLYDPGSMRGYHYLVDWPLGRMLNMEAGTEVSTSHQRDCYRGNNPLSFLRKWKKLCFKTRPDRIIDIEKVWQSDGGTLLSPDLKDACLSFSLFHLLRRRFFGLGCVESPQQKTHDFVFRGLLAKNEAGAMDYKRVFKVIEVELDFMYDFFFTKYAAIHYGDFESRYVMPLSIATLALIAAFLTPGGLPLGQTNKDSPSVFVLDNTPADVGFTVAVLVCISVLQVVQVLYYWTTNWGRISLACQRVTGSAGSCMRLKELLVHIGLLMSGCCWCQHGEKLGQYSLLESLSKISNQTMVTKCLVICETWLQNMLSTVQGWVIGEHMRNDRWCVLRKPGKTAKLLPAIKKAVAQSLERTQGKLTNGESSLVSNAAGALLWACKLVPPAGIRYTSWSLQKEGNQVLVILIWHVATCYCDKELLAVSGVTEELKEHHEVATALSKYAAYLVVFNPKLLPGHHYATWCVLQWVVGQAINELNGMLQDDETIYRKGLRLGEQLKNMEAARCWKVLADFWAEMLLYLAPSDNVNEHVECLAKGGELITHLWALLTHAGILTRGERNNVTNDAENPRGGPSSYTYSGTSTTQAAPSTSGTNQRPTTSNPTVQTVMMVHQPAIPVQNGQGAPDDASNALSEIEEIA